MQIESVMSVSEVNISIYLKKSVIFCRMLQDFHTIEKILIWGDASSLIFKTIENVCDETDCIYLSLKFINLLAYGNSWYNRLGFGKQSDEWSIFIKKNFFILLFQTNIDLTDSELSILFIYERCTISETFKDIICNLKEISIKKDRIYIINEKYKEYVLLINKLLVHICEEEDKEQTDEGLIYYTQKYIPNFNPNTDYIM